MLGWSVRYGEHKLCVGCAVRLLSSLMVELVERPILSKKQTTLNQNGCGRVPKGADEARGVKVKVGSDRRD